MEKHDVRWKQRFKNFEIVFLRFKKAAEMPKLNKLERDGLIQLFKFTLELSWKVLKDFLEEKGFAFKSSPKDTLRQAQESGYINFARELIDGLDIRNELSHDYSGDKFEISEKQLREDTFVALNDLYKFFVNEQKT